MVNEDQKKQIRDYLISKLIDEKENIKEKAKLLINFDSRLKKMIPTDTIEDRLAIDAIVDSVVEMLKDKKWKEKYIQAKDAIDDCNKELSKIEEEEKEKRPYDESLIKGPIAKSIITGYSLKEKEYKFLDENGNEFYIRYIGNVPFEWDIGVVKDYIECFTVKEGILNEKNVMKYIPPKIMLGNFNIMKMLENQDYRKAVLDAVKETNGNYIPKIIKDKETGEYKQEIDPRGYTLATKYQKEIDRAANKILTASNEVKMENSIVKER